MSNKHFLRGMATVSYFAEDVIAARDWYAKLFGVEAYFQMPSPEAPAYVEFRIGDDADEFGIIASQLCAQGHASRPGRRHPPLARRRHRSRLRPPERARRQANTRPITPRGDTGFITASVVDPFGNVLGIMQNPHWLASHGGPAEV